MSMSDIRVILFRAAGVPVGIGHRDPGIAAFLAFRHIADARERQMGRGNEVLIFHKVSERMLAYACRLFSSSS